MSVIYGLLCVPRIQLFSSFTESNPLRDQKSHTHYTQYVHSKVPNQAQQLQGDPSQSAVPGLLPSHWQHSRLEKWNGSTIGQQLLFWNFSRFFKTNKNKQKDKHTTNGHKAAITLALISNSKLSGFLGEAEPIQKTTASRSHGSARAYAGGPIRHRRCSPGDPLEAAAGSSGYIHLRAVLAGRQVGIQALLAPLQVVEVWVRQGTVGRYSFGWVECQALLW